MPSLRHRFRRSVLEFLALPALIVFVFVVLAESVDWFDNHAGPRGAWGPIRIWLSQYVGDTQAAIGVLTAIAGSLFTVTSVTFSILLLAVQQGATILNSQITDHYLRRRANRAWFGFFVGVSVFVLITLVQTTHTKAPIFGVTVSTLLGAATLASLIILIYSTVDQTRPSTVLQSIAEAARAARSRQEELLRATAPLPKLKADGISICAPQSGYLTSINVSKLHSLLASHAGARLFFMCSIGDYLPQGAPVAQLSGSGPVLPEKAILDALLISEERDVATDPAYSLDHLATIGWTAISTAHSDPAVGSIAVHTLQGLLHAWSHEPERAPGASALVFYDDRLPQQTLESFEGFMVAATESRQLQTMAVLLRSLSTSLPLLPAHQQERACRLTDTAAIALREHVQSHSLREATHTLCLALKRVGQPSYAERLQSALQSPESPASTTSEDLK